MTLILQIGQDESSNSLTTSCSTLQPPAEMESFEKLMASFSKSISPEAIQERIASRDERRRNNNIDLGSAIANAVSMNAVVMNSNYTCTNLNCKRMLSKS